MLESNCFTSQLRVHRDMKDLGISLRAEEVRAALTVSPRAAFTRVIFVLQTCRAILTRNAYLTRKLVVNYPY